MLTTCIYHADLSRVVARKKFLVEGSRRYFEVFLWESTDALQKDNECRNGVCEKNILGVTCPAPYKDGTTPEILGEIHFARNSWNLEVVAHECLHATIHAMHVYNIDLLNGFMEEEERLCYLHGHLFEDVYRWLWNLEKA